MAEEPIYVSKSEYFSELAGLKWKHKRLEDLKSERFSLMGRMSGIAREKRRLLRRMPFARVVERLQIGERIRELDREYDKLYTQFRHVLYTEIPDAWEKIEAERRRLRRKVIPPPVPPEEEFISSEECSGFNIYFDTVNLKYMIRDPDNNKLLHEDDYIAMELTASLETETERAHEPLDVEITCTSYMAEMGISDLVNAEREVKDGLINWLKESPWASAIGAFQKIGVAYNSQTHVEKVGRYPWDIPEYPDVHISIEKKRTRKATYKGEFRVEI